MVAKSPLMFPGITELMLTAPQVEVFKQQLLEFSVSQTASAQPGLIEGSRQVLACLAGEPATSGFESELPALIEWEILQNSTYEPSLCCAVCGGHCLVVTISHKGESVKFTAHRAIAYN